MKLPSIKDIKMKKFSNQIVLALNLGIFFSFFFISSSNLLLNKYNYQSNVISLQNKALISLNNDIKASKDLASSYNQFVSPTNNIIGGVSAAPDSTNGGDNSKIVLDALPSSYDFPEFITTLQNLILSQGVKISSISGTDQSATLSGNMPSIVTPIAFQVTVKGNYDQIQNLINTFQQSIRPIDILKINLSGDQNSLTVTISAQTYYQPSVKFIINKRVIN